MIVDLTHEEVEAALNKARADKLYVETLLTPKPPPVVKVVEPEPTGLFSAAKFARHIGKSVPTVHRLREEGMPAQAVGNSWRFPVAECVAWLAARGKKPTVAKVAAVDSIDIGDVLRGHGLKAVCS